MTKFFIDAAVRRATSSVIESDEGNHGVSGKSVTCRYPVTIQIID